MYWFVDCDITGGGKQWRLASRTGNTFFFPEQDFREHVEHFDKSGCRYLGPFTALDLLSFVEVAENAARFVTLPQDTPGESRVDAATANAMVTASMHAKRHLNHQRHNWE